MAKLAKYLPEYGWEPGVICSSFSQNNCDMYDPALMTSQVKNTILKALPVRRRYKLSKLQFMNDALFLLSHLNILAQALLSRYIPRFYFTAPPEYYCEAISFLRKYLKHNHVDCILATFPSPATFAVADKIKKEFAIPWLADFRDTYDIRMQVRKGEKMRQALLRQEPHVTKSSSAILTVSEALQLKLQNRHNRPITVLPNGFDPEDYETTKAHNLKKFTVLYTGTIYYPDQDPMPLLMAVDHLRNKGLINAEKFSVEFVGIPSSDLKLLLEKFDGIDEFVHICGVVPHRESISLQKGAHVLLHLAHGAEKGIMTGKLFEYLAARRPILCIPGDKDCVEDTLKRCRAGVVCRNQEEVEKQLLSWYQEWGKRGSIPYRGIDSEIVKYSRREQAGELSELLNNCISDNGR